MRERRSADKMNRALEAAENFSNQDESITGIEEYGHGIIHDTYLVRLDNGAKKIILQRINSEVFTDPAAVMHNLHLVCEHIRKRSNADGSRTDAGWPGALHKSPQPPAA